METKGKKPTSLKIGEEFQEASIYRAIRKLVKMKQIRMRCTYKDAVEKTVDFLIQSIKELEREEKQKR